MKNIALVWTTLLLAGASFSQGLVEGEIQHDFIGSQSDTVTNVILFNFYEEPSSAVERAVNDKIMDRLNSSWNADTTDRVLSKAYLEKLIANFEADFASSEGDGYEMAWQLEISIHIQEFEHSVQLSIAEWAYAGGAHGNSAYTAWVFDKISGKELAISDFFEDEIAVNAIFEKTFRDLIQIDADMSLEEAGYWFDENVFALNSNFYFSNSSMYVYFNTYEITDYATGPTELEVPLEILRPLMIREF